MVGDPEIGRQATEVHGSARLMVRRWLATLVLSACAAGPSAAHRREGMAAFEAGRFDEAELGLRLALAEKPGDAEARARLGLVLVRRGRPWAAYRELSLSSKLGSSTGRRELHDLVRRREASLRAATAAPPSPQEDAASALLTDFEAHLRGAGERFPTEEIAGRLLVAKELPPWARPTRARVAGGDAAAAVREVLPSLGAAPPAARLLVAVEAALAGDPEAHALLEGQPPGLSLELAAATVARLGGRADAEAAALARAATLPGGVEALARRGDAAALRDGNLTGIRRWLDGARGRGADVDPPLPAPRPGCRADQAALAEIRRAIRDGLGRADRLARAYADSEVGAWCRVPELVAEWRRAGDVARARGWAEELVADVPDDPGANLLLARVLIAEGNPRRAKLSLTVAEERAARRGVAATLVAHDLRRAGMFVPAIGAARLALEIAGPAERPAAFEAAVAAQLAAGRAADAERVFERYRGELPPALVPLAAARIRDTLGVALAPPWLPLAPDWLDRRVAVARIADLEAAGDRDALLLIARFDDGPRGTRASAALRGD